jgi:hypothetical protein
LAGDSSNRKKSNAEKQAYIEGYEAGKAALRQELKALITTLNEKHAYSTYASTYTTLS